MLTDSDRRQIQEILNFWFGQIKSDGTYLKERSKLWYGSNKSTDERIKERFGKALQSAIYETNIHWAEDRSGSLALVILLDQFSRHVFRRTPEAYAQDPLARAIAMRAVNKGFDVELTIPERLFLYHPFHHSETLEDQDFGLQIVESLSNSCEPAWRDSVNSSLLFFKDHHETIARFGRFPHRNEVLGRQSTPDEEEYIKSSSSFGQ